MVKIKLKNSFWKQKPETQIEKLMSINYYTTGFLLTNLAYSLIKSNTFMIITNTFITIFFIILNISYEKRNKKCKK